MIDFTLKKKLKNIFNDLPTGPGVYIFKDRKDEPVYIGKAKNIHLRLKSYLAINQLATKTLAMLAKVNKVEIIPVASEIEALLLEAEAIKRFKPKYNTLWKDDKSYLYIKIDFGKEVPLITTSRRQPEDKSVKLFGPFPSATTVRYVLKILRRIFPYCSSTHEIVKTSSGRTKYKRCLYCHLGLCPFPYESNEKANEYRKTVKKIITFLEGKNDKLIASLKREMNIAVKMLAFEKAAIIKKQIDALEYITKDYHGPSDYLTNPMLFEDIVYLRLLDLTKQLKLSKFPNRIECYDVSNLGGKLAVGAMVVLKDGKLANNLYRHFKIKFKNTPDDFAMLKEIIKRRFKNNWPLPDLIVVDGGKGQLSALSEVLDSAGLNIPHIAIAKKKELIYSPNNKEPLVLPKDSFALQLVQQIRDEAHRFAISYHRKLRHNSILTL